MRAAILTIAGVLTIGVLYVVVPVVADAYSRFRRARAVTCPETGRPATIKLDARYAAFTAAFGDPSLRLTDCSRWPEQEDCARECLRQIA